MIPSRYAQQPSNTIGQIRKSRLDVKASLIPKPRNAGSMDRLSADMRRPSNARSSSAEGAPWGTMNSGRLSREASAKKLPLNSKSRSHQGEQSYCRATTSMMTPLRSYSRATATPQRTPSDDRRGRSWQTSLDRALAFVTTKDLRQISNPVWQRTTYHQVQEILVSRGLDGSFPRPLTITRFVEITRALLVPMARDPKLSNDNYVVKIPHLAKLLLYPGTVSKSWLQSVNTLHAFPHALALIAYLLDLVNRIEEPVTDECLYLDRSEFAMLQKDYVTTCFIRLQEKAQDLPDHYIDINEEYLDRVRQLFGNADDQIAELQQVIKRYEDCLEDEAEQAARLDEQRRVERKTELLAALRAERAAHVATNTEKETARNSSGDTEHASRALLKEIEQANAESVQLQKEVESQPMTREDRAKLLDEVDYKLRVQDSKRVLAEQISKMVFAKESELALWQNNTLNSCTEYNERLVQLYAQFPDFVALQVDPKDLMGPKCAQAVSAAVDALKQKVSSMGEHINTIERTKNAQKRHRTQKVEEFRATISELKSLYKRELESFQLARSAESVAAEAWPREERELRRKLEELEKVVQENDAVMSELRAWEQQEQLWLSKLADRREFVKTATMDARKILEEEMYNRGIAACDAIKICNDALDKISTAQ